MLIKEELLKYLMQGYVHLSKKDYGFYNNLTYIINDRKQITSNQSKLFDKLLVKYQRQLRKNGYELDTLQKLKWQVAVVESKEEFLTPKISINDGVLELRTPFNTKFVQQFRRLNNNNFEWDKGGKVYKAPFATHLLKMAIDLSVGIFGKIDSCNQVQKLLDEIKIYDNTTFDPILVERNGNYFIANINNALYDATKDIPLDGSAQSLFELTKFGIQIDKDIFKDDKFLKFASEIETTMDLDDLLNNIDYFKQLNVDQIIYPYIVLRSKTTLDPDLSINNFFKKHGITVVQTHKEATGNNVFYVKRTFSNDGLYNRRYSLIGPISKVNKVIDIKNSRPIDIK